MNRGAIRLLLVIALPGVFVLSGCSSPEKELRKAKAAGTLEALDAFLERHPEGPLAEQAKDAKEQLVFDGAKQANTMAAYEDFLKRFPGGKLAGAAQAAIEELHFKDAQAAGTIQAYEKFLSQHPQGAKANQASQALDRLLPSGTVTARVDVTKTNAATCTVLATVTILHRSDALSADTVPAAAQGTMNCSGTSWSTGAEIEEIVRRDANHTFLRLRLYSAPEYTGCRGTCTVRFSVMGQEHAATAIYE